MRNKPRIKVKSGEHPQQTAQRYHAMGKYIRDRKRDLLILSLLIITMSFLLIKVLNARVVPKISDLPEHIIHIEKITCKTQRVHVEYGYYDYWYDLHIQSYGFLFVAANLPRNICRRLSKSIKPETDVWITHYRGLIYKLRDQKKTLLGDKLLRKGIQGQFRYAAFEYEVVFYTLLLFLPVYWIYISAHKPK